MAVHAVRGGGRGAIGKKSKKRRKNLHESSVIGKKRPCAHKTERIIKQRKLLSFFSFTSAQLAQFSTLKSRISNKVGFSGNFML